MSVITYIETEARCAVEKVYLDGKLVGYVRADTAGYYYEPIGGKSRGVSFPSTRHVHRSLED